jgi:hypothetical protein
MYVLGYWNGPGLNLAHGMIATSTEFMHDLHVLLPPCVCARGAVPFAPEAIAAWTVRALICPLENTVYLIQVFKCRS